MNGRKGLAALLLFSAAAAVLAIRIGLLWSFQGNFDTDAFRLAADTAARGGDLYAIGPYNYSPVWAQVLRALAGLGAAWKLDLARMTGLALTAADIVSAALLYVLSRERFGRAKSALVALVFFANPVSVLISSRQGQFDNVSILFLLAALLLLRREKTGGATAALSLSLCVKHVTWFHPLLFTARRRPRIAVALAALPYVVFLASFLPYRDSWRAVWEKVFRYRGHTGIYGLDGLLAPLPELRRALVPVLFLAAMLAATLLLSRVEIGRASLLLMLVQMIFLPGFGRQYCAWPIALGALSPSPGYLLYTLVSAGFLLDWLPDWNGPWFAAIFWLGWELTARVLQRTEEGRARTSSVTLAGA